MLTKLILLTTVAVGSAVGCSRGGLSGTLPVSGTVTYNGRAVPQATVTFVGEGDARTAVAVTDTAGRYQLKTLDSIGAMPGKYTVLVSRTESAADNDRPISMDEAAQNRGKAAEPKQLVPLKYSNPTKTPLTCEVKPGQTNHFDLPLSD
jgi:carboxypeptidase family protein